MPSKLSARNPGSALRRPWSPYRQGQRIWKAHLLRDRPRGEAGEVEADDVVCGQRPQEALQPELVHRHRQYEVADCGVDSLADQYLAVLGHVAQARGEVRDGADRRVVDATFEADAAERRVTLRDAEGETEVVAAPAPFGCQLADGAPHRDAHLDRPDRGVRTRERVVEEDHQA